MSPPEFELEELLELDEVLELEDVLELEELLVLAPDELVELEEALEELLVEDEVSLPPQPVSAAIVIVANAKE